MPKRKLFLISEGIPLSYGSAVAFDCRRFSARPQLTLTKMNPSPAPSTRKTIAGR